MRRCGACGEPLEGDKRKKFCSDACRNRGHRGATVTEIPPVEGEVTASTRRSLEKASRIEHPSGAAAMVLARRLDKGGDTGSAIAALARELRAAIEAAVADAPVVDDPVDEFTRRRQLRVAGT